MMDENINDIENKKFCALAYQVFSSEAGKAMLRVLEANFVNPMFSSLMTGKPISTEEMAFKMGQRDLVQRLRLFVQEHEAYLRKKQEHNDV